ncbi:MAG: class I SAM-dependent methyltransferase [Nitrospinaceae bacterium]|nr:MAG: class I SAM-dependent methyltransferase [Nitrospinaceae bacterium]
MSPRRTTPYPIDGFDYRLLDSGDFQKLEQFGPHRFIRPAPQAIWPKTLPVEEWRKADGKYEYFKGKESGGEWTLFHKLPKDGWRIGFDDLRFLVKPTGFGHIGLFPEQALNWNWITDQLRRSGRAEGANVLNIFGYTGASTLAAARAGARVTHVDASKASVSWARTNLEISGLGERPVRWIVDDVIKFLTREHKRGRKYDGLILDPPSFGRGPRGEVWKIENKLSELMELSNNILSERPLFLLLTTHSPGFSGLTMQNMLLSYLVKNGGGFKTGEMYIYDNASGLDLPNGFFSRWSSLPEDTPSGGGGQARP